MKKMIFKKLIEHVLIYAKNKQLFKPNKPYEEYDLTKFCWEISELTTGKSTTLGGKQVFIFQKDEYTIKKIPYSQKALKETWASGSVLKGNTSGKFFDKELSQRIEIDGYGCLYKVQGIGEDGLGYRYFTGPKKIGATKGKFYSGVPLDRLEEIEYGESKKYNPIINFYDYSADFGNISHEGNMVFRGGKKPIKMISHFMQISNITSSDIVMDFFCGSGTTAHAVMQLNAEDGGNRRYICVQLAEETDENSEARKAGFANIAEIAKERIRRAGAQIRRSGINARQNMPSENADTAAGAVSGINARPTVDTGFKVFKLTESHFKQWRRPLSGSLNDQQQLALLEEFQNIVHENAGVENMAYELMLRLGFELTDSIEFADNVVWLNNTAQTRKTALLLDTVNQAVLDEVRAQSPKKVFVLDKAFAGDDALKTNAALQFKDAGVDFETL